MLIKTNQGLSSLDCSLLNNVNWCSSLLLLRKLLKASGLRMTRLMEVDVS